MPDQGEMLLSEPNIWLAGGIEVMGAKKALITPRDRRIIALFAVNAGSPLRPQDIAMELWGSNDIGNVSSVITRLSNCIGLNLVKLGLSSRVLGVEPNQVDVLRFIRRVQELQRYPPSDLVEGMAAWSQALSILRGPVFCDIEPGVLLQNWAKRIRAYQSTVMCQLYHIHLRQGQHVLIVERLWVDWSAQPERQDLACLLIIALYRSLRPHEVSHVYLQTKQALNGLGLEPDKRLKAVYDRVLQEDETLLDFAQPIPGF